MIYEGKEYVEVTDGSAEIGDLLSTTKVSYKDGQFSHFDKLYYFALDNEQYPLTERIMQNGSRIQAYSPKPFKRYRYVKDVENNTEKAHRELKKTIIKIDKEMIKHLKKSKKAHDLINQTSKNIKQTDTVNSPSHYNQTKIEAIDIIEDVTAGYQSNVKYHIGNAIKYLIRAPFKNHTVEDLKKSVWYTQRAIEKLEGEE